MFNSTHMLHAPSEWQHLTPALIPNVETSSHSHIFAPIFRAHSDMHDNQGLEHDGFAHVKYDFVQD